MAPAACEHRPVMLEEVAGLLDCAPGKWLVDATVGAGGHARALLEKTAPDGRLLGVDWDEEALALTRRNLAAYGHRLILIRENFARLGAVLARLHLQAVDGILLDLGVSSLQLDAARRGFSFSRPGPLDMRMDTRMKTTAAQLLNNLGEEQLASLIHDYGEERWSRKIARAIVRARQQQPIETTDRLARLVLAAIPPSKRPRHRHPATRTFQALRLAVNREIDNLRAFLEGALHWLEPGGRLAIISFHSLEDRLVKQTFAHWALPCRCPAGAPVCRCEGRPLVRLIRKKPVRPSPEEVAANPRARSARLRVVEKLKAQ